MNRFRRIWNQNTKKILLILFIILIIFIVIQILNYFAKVSEGEQRQERENELQEYVGHQSEQSITSGGTVEKHVDEQVESTIEEFIHFCNEGDTQKAYEMLSNDCREELYPSLENFTNTYYRRNFNTKKLFSMQSWVVSSLTYKVTLHEDILSTGRVEDSVIEDYYTIVQEDGSWKLNIAGFIQKQELNQAVQNAGITIQILNKKTYMEYEEYQISVRNETGKTILLDSMETSSGIYLLGSTGAQYSVYTSELEETKLRVQNNDSNILSLKFGKEYNTNRAVESIHFTDIILDAESYQQTTNPSTYEERMNIEIML